MITMLNLPPRKVPEEEKDGVVKSALYATIFFGVLIWLTGDRNWAWILLFLYAVFFGTWSGLLG